MSHTVSQLVVIYFNHFAGTALKLSYQLDFSRNTHNSEIPIIKSFIY